MLYPIGTNVKPNDFYALAQALNIAIDCVGVVVAHKFNKELNQIDNMVKFPGIDIAPCSDCELDLYANH